MYVRKKDQVKYENKKISMQQYDQCIKIIGVVSIFSVFKVQDNTNGSSIRKRDSPNPPLFLLGLQ